MRKPLILCLAILFALAPALVLAHGKGHVKGTISAVGPDHLMVKGEDGKEIHIALTNKTRFSKGKAAATAADAKVGSRVVVHLGDDGNAAQVQLPEDKPKQ
ncbi:MAG: hypothetical protein ACRD1B_10365 [Thermoanaerobaculia bacterium]